MFEKYPKPVSCPPVVKALGNDPIPKIEPQSSKAARIDPLAATRISPDPPSHPSDVSSKESDDRALDGRYRLVEKLGEGGMGTVYRAKHALMDKTVAIKVIHQELSHSDAITKRFEREAKSASRLTDPHCINVTDFGRTSDGKLFLVMEYLQGETLAARLRKTGPLPFQKAIHIARHILKALGHAHKAGVVHRDLKPDNVMLVTHGDETDYVKVFDFGIAKMASGDGSDESLTQAGLVLGTPAYLSPEQGKGRTIDHRADLYAVGVILFEILAGFRPFKGSSAMDTVMAHVDGPIPTLPKSCNAPRALHKVLKKSLAKNPEDRFESAEQFIDALDTFDPSSEKNRSNPIALWGLRYSLPPATARFLSKFTSGLHNWVARRPEQKDVPTLSNISLPAQERPAQATSPKKRLFVAGASGVLCVVVLLIIATWSSQPSNTVQAMDLSDVQDKKLAGALEKARTYLEEGDGKKASSSARKALRLSPDNPLANLVLGHALYLRADRLGATKAYERALTRDQSFGSDVLVQEHLKDSLSYPKSRQNAAAVLAKLTGEDGIEFLTSRANSAAASGEERAAARQALIDTKNGPSINWVASLTADFRQYESCNKKRDIVSQMEITGDQRFLPLLEAELKEITSLQSGHKDSRCPIADDLKRAYRTLEANAGSR